MPRNYEALLIFAGNVNEDSLDKAIERANGDIEKLGGKIESVENLGRKQFARVMGKCESGVYVKTRFAIEPEQISAIHARFALNDECFRIQIILRNERIEAAKKVDDARRAAYKAKVAEAAAAAEAQTEEA